MREGKIDALTDFTDKGLGELQAWLGSRFKRRAAAGGAGTPGPPGDGIQFDVDPQDGGFLVATATNENDEGNGIQLSSSGDGQIVLHTTGTELAGIELTAEAEGGGGITIDSYHGGGIRIHEQGDGGMIIRSSGGGMIIKEDGDGGLVVVSSLDLELSSDDYGDIVFDSSGPGIRIAPKVGQTLRLQHIPTVDPAVTDAIWNDGGTLVFSGSRAPRAPILYSFPGLLVVGIGGLPWEALTAGSISLVHARLGTLATGSGVVVTVKKNGTSIGSLTIGASTATGSFVPASPAYAVGDVFTVDITAIGSTLPGGDLVVQLKLLP